jgi:hypothetical protein
MDEFLARDLAYAMRVDEIVWGGILLAITLVIHGTGMFHTLRINALLRDRTEGSRSRAVSMGILILAAWMIVLCSLTEVLVWALFFYLRGAQPNLSSAFYHGLLNYTTIEGGYLPMRWRLLEAMLAMSGLLTFAWSTSILFSVAQALTDQALREYREQRRQDERGAAVLQAREAAEPGGRPTSVPP